MSKPGIDARRADVVVVGGGPVGLGLAIELGLRGVDVAVIERRDKPSSIPKGQNLTQRTMEHFHFWGAESRLRAQRIIPREFGSKGVNCYGSLLSGYSYEWLRRDAVGQYYYADNERLPQYATEAVLRERAKEIGRIRLLEGWEAVHAEDLGDAALVRASLRDGSAIDIRADYAVGCDGSHSMVRDAAGIAEEVADHGRLMALLVFRSTELHGLLERYPGTSFFCALDPELDGYWRFLGRVDLGTTWFFHCPVPPGTDKDSFDFKSLLHAAVGRAFEAEIDHVGFWNLRFSTASRYRSGRFFVAGDAAHSHPPYGAYGINTGFEDARNLGWKLEAVLSGWGGNRLLDSHNDERRPVYMSTASSFIEAAIENDRAFLRRYDPGRDRAEFERAWAERSSQSESEVTGFVPNYCGSPIVHGPENGRSGAVGRHSNAARPGHHLTPSTLSDGRNAYEALGQGFTLFRFGARPGVADEFRKSAAESGIPLTIVEDRSPMARRFYESELVLVRPDQFVAWTDSEGGSPAEVLARCAGR